MPGMKIGEDAWPPGLQEAVYLKRIPLDDVPGLRAIRYRGLAPCTVEDWRAIWSALRLCCGREKTDEADCN